MSYRSQKKKNRQLRIEELAQRIVLDAAGFLTPVIYSPTPYLSEADTPDGFVSDPDCPACVVGVENFEDGSLDFGITISNGQIIDANFSTGTTSLADSVDSDDGVIDGTGNTDGRGSNWFSDQGSVRITFPSLMQSAGVVWTDGSLNLTDVVFEAFDQDGNSLGTTNAGDISDGSNVGTTADDHFFGASFGNGVATGITAITITNIGGNGGLEIDHIQFANCSDCCEVDLELTKTVDASVVDSGDTVTWTLSVTNNATDGENEATGVRVGDILPAGVTLTSSSATDGTYNPLTGVWTLADTLELGEVETLTLVTTVDSGLAGGTVIENTAQITNANEDDIDSTPGNDDGDQSEDDEDNASITLASVIDLEVSKSVNTSVVNTGDLVNWTVVVTNNAANANTAATGVALTDLIPAGTTLNGVNVSEGSFSIGTGVWTLATSLLPGESETIILTTKIDAGLAGGSMLQNVAQVSAADQTDVDSIPNNDDGDQSEDDEANAKVTLAGAIDLELTKTVDSTIVEAGDLVRWTIEVTNNEANANAAATGVQVTDLIPAGTTLSGVDVSEGTFNIGTGVWTLATSLLPGESESIVLTTTIGSGLASGSMLQNVTQVSAADQTDVDSIPNNDDGDQSEDDEANAKVTLAGAIDLELTKTVDSDLVDGGDTVTWTIEVTNNAANANVAATGVGIIDVLPNGVTLTSAVPSGNGVFSGDVWSLIDPLAPGETATLLLTTTVDDGLAGGTMLVNTAQVAAANEIDIDSVPNNDDGDQSEDDEDNAKITVAHIIDLELTKVVDATLIGSGDTVTWTISLTNNAANANTAATGVGVVDLVPAGTTLVSATPSGNGVFLGEVWSLIDPIAPGATETLTLTSSIDSGLAGGTMLVNTAYVAAATQTDIDSSPGSADLSEDDADSAKVTIESVIDLELTKVATQSVVQTGDIIDWQITLTNNALTANTDATGVVVLDAIPSAVSLLTASTTGNSTFLNDQWIINEPISPGEVLTLTLRTVVDDGFSGTVITNEAEVASADQTDVDSTPESNGDNGEDDEATARVGVQDLSLLMLSGHAYIDVNNDGIFKSYESPLLGVEIQLIGNDHFGNSVTQTTFTNSDGFYKFNNLVPGTYMVKEVQPQQFVDGKDSLGNLLGDDSVNDKFTVSLVATNASNYNFGERGLRPEFVNKRLYLTSTPYTEWQHIDVRQNSIWHSFDVDHQSFLELNAVSQSGDNNIVIYDADMNEVGALSVTGGEVKSVIALPDSGEYYMEVSGQGVLAELALEVTAPDVNQNGDTVIAVATQGDDEVVLSLGTSEHILNINGLIYTFDATEVDTFHVGASIGEDNVTVHGTFADDRANIMGTSGEIRSDNYLVKTYTFDNTTFVGGGGSDYGQIFGSLGDDKLSALPEDVTVTTPDTILAIQGFDRVDAYGRSGSDYASIFGTQDDDLYFARDEYALMAGGGVTTFTKGFERVDAFGRGGRDTANLYDSSGDDTFVSTPGYAYLVGGPRVSYTKGFERVDSISTKGGNDKAFFYDDANTNDTFVARADYAYMTNGSYTNYAKNFDLAYAEARGGNDTAQILDLKTGDRFSAAGAVAHLIAEDRDEKATGFDTVILSTQAGATPTADYDANELDFALAENVNWINDVAV